MEAKLKLGILSLTLLAAAGGSSGCSGDAAKMYISGGTGTGGGAGTGSPSGSGGTTGTGGTIANPGTGGVSGTAGSFGTGNSSGQAGTSGDAGTTGTAGSGGTIPAGSGGTTGTGGTTGAAGTGGGTGGSGAGGSTPTGPINVLIWNNALSYGHASRVNAIQYLKMREATDNIKFDTTYAHTGTATDGPSDSSFDASVFADDKLDKYDVVFFLDTTGTTIDDGQKASRRQALQDFITKKGRGFVGTHSATDTYQNNSWPWYVDFIGANFSSHSQAGASGTAQYYQNNTHPILMDAKTPNPWNRKEEWYNFNRNPLSTSIAGLKIILSCHDQTFTTERPTAWVHEMPVMAPATRGGRLFYTAFGHATSAFQEKEVMDLIISGIKWAAYRL
ncbi:MAG: ThuA domain-containing protein [Myxococcales bacterium]